MTADYAVLDLFCGLGGFSQAFEASDRWAVTTVDIEARFDPDIQADVFDLRPSEFDREFDVVLASPPCVDFSVACITDKWSHAENRRPKHLPRKFQIADSIALVFRTLWLVQKLQPDYWFMENPQGMLRTWLGEPVAQVHYCQYGAPFKKPTDLWGDHPPMHYQTCPGRRRCGHTSNPREVNTFRDESRTRAVDSSNSAQRAKIPHELSEAIRDACEAGLDGEVPEQTTLEGINA